MPNIPSFLSELNLTTTVSVLLAFSSLFVNVLITKMNNNHQLKLRKLELYKDRLEHNFYHERYLFEQYMHYLGRYIMLPDRSTKEEYGEHFYSALLYASKEVASLMVSIDDAVWSDNPSEASEQAQKLTPLLQEMLAKHLAESQ